MEQQQQQQRLHDEASKIAAELEQWRSPKLGILSVSEDTYRYERDETAWLRGGGGGDEERNDGGEIEMEVDDDDIEEEEEEEEEAPPAGVQTPHRPIERAGTPVMSNASQRGQTSTRRRYINMMETPGEDKEEAEAELPVDIQSPWVPRRMGDGGVSSSTTRTAGAGATTTAATFLVRRRGMPTMKGSHTDYRRYYEALLTYIRGKRALKERIDLEQQHKAVLLLGQQPNTEQQEEVAMDIEPVGDDMPWKASTAATLSTTTTSNVAAKLVNDEAFLEHDFLLSLNALCWGRATGDNPASDPARKEGNFWLLLSSLREQGLSCLIWEDDALSKRQHENSVQAFVQDLARQVEATPKELIDILHNNKSRPLILQRRQQILHWLEHCFQKILPAGSTRTRNATFLTNSQTSLTQDLPETDKDAEILHCALALILAGRLSDAQKLARDSGVPWRAAVWGGGQPHGYKQEGDDNHEQTTGNADRFLWKRMMWLQSEKLMADPAAMADEAAIAALLSCHSTNALSNSSLRTWEHGLLSCIRCLMARTEDEVLHQHNNNRRQMHPSPRYPGTQHEDMERQVLQSTSELAGYDEADVVLMLSSSPFEQMQRKHTATDASASFLAGKSAILAFFQNAVAYIQQSSMQDDDDEDSVFVLRFLSHVAIYLDSLASCTTPILLDNIKEWKNELVSRYVEVLASRKDLWYMVVLYASLLPEKYLLETLPKLLSVLESPKEREVVVGHLQEFMPKSNNLDVQVLRRVVQVVLQEHETHAPDLKNASKLDVRKMKAILWLRVDDIHVGEALIWSNQLLRQFLLAGKFRSALTFVRDILRKDGLVDVFDDSDMPLPCSDNLQHARKEFEAWTVYLDALEILERWRHVVMEQTGASTSKKAMSSPARDHERRARQSLSRTEAAIADRIEYRNIIQSKRESMSSVVSAAAKASAALQGVLEFSGGWLWVEEDEAVEAEGSFGGRGELDELRAQLLPQVVQLFQDVCLDTSAWLSGALDDVAIALNEDRKAALQAIDEAQESGLSSPMSPAYWARKALDIVQVVVSDTYKISSVFGPADLKGVLDRAAESAIDELVLQT